MGINYLDLNGRDLTNPEKTRLKEYITEYEKAIADVERRIRLFGIAILVTTACVVLTAIVALVFFSSSQ